MAVVGIQPFVATLILMTMGRGIAQLITEGRILTFTDPDFAFFGSGSFLRLPVPAWLWLLAGLFAQLRQCQGLISVDTATVHIAAGLHKPILGLYNPDIGGGNENFLEWHPNSPSATVLFSTNTREQDINSLDLAEFERTFRAWLLANQAALSAVQSPARA